MPTYLNTAAFGLIDPALKTGADAFYTNLAREGSPVAEHWRDEMQPQIRQNLASFLGTESSQVAMIPNFSWGLNALVHSLRGNERILLYRGDYPSVSEPFVMNGFQISWVDSLDDFNLPVDEILSQIRRHNVDILVLSHVQYNSGYTLDLRLIGDGCREHGVWFIVDATQSLGAMPLNASALPVDVLISSHYKWMNAGFGTGSIYCSTDFLQAFPPKSGGANSYLKPGQNWKEEAPMRAWEPGHPNMYALNILDASIRQKQAAGLSEIASHNMALTGVLHETIAGRVLPLIGAATMENRCSILVFEDKDGLAQRLSDAGITATIRGGRVRISIHAHNTDADIRACANALLASEY